MADRGRSGTGLPAQSVLREILECDPDTGVLTWRRKVGGGKEVNRFNSRYAGRRAGSAPKGTARDPYRKVRIDGVNFYEHRVVWAWVYGPIPDGLWIDHIDGDKLNNSPRNLRLVEPALNSANCTWGSGRSRYRGVDFDPRRNRWEASVSFMGKRHYAKRCRCETAAAIARDRKARELSPYLRLNIEGRGEA